MRAPQIVEPFACGLCGIPLPHGRQYLDGVGMHLWERPSDAQILARMKARRLARVVAREGALPVPVGVKPLVSGWVDHSSWEDQHNSPLHHDYRVSHDLPVREVDDPARCLTVHEFSPRDGWRMVCGNCDHGKGADCHQAGGLR